MKTSRNILSYLAQFFLECEMFQTKVVKEIKTHILYSVTFFFQKRAVCVLMWKNILQRGRPQMTIWRMRIACWMTKATNTHSHYVIHIGFPVQQWLHQRASILRYIGCPTRY
jgi:hypothetical protein